MPRYEERLREIPYPFIENEDGSRSTHRMAAEVDENGNWFAFPTIQQGEDGVLVEFDDNREAMANAMASGNIKEFGGDKDAAIGYAQGGYKAGTNIDDPREKQRRIAALLRGL